MAEDVTSLKRKLALTYQILYMEGITKEDTLGHVSARLSGESKSYVKPWGMGFEEVTPDNLLAMDLEGNKVEEGEGRLHSEMPIHNEIYKVRPDVNCIVHIHPFYATLLSSMWKGKILVVNQSTQHFSSGITFYKSSELIRSKDQGKELAATLGKSYVVLLKNHGIVTVGPTIEQTLVLTVQLEKAAHTHLTLSRFADVTEIPTEVASRWADELINMAHCTNKLNYWSRKLKREGTGVWNG
ncbi:MAG TPA: class II aldolase/adducin family protein [bacterium]|nr:class II aldolase/adducin family protein [bacterium]